MNDSIQKEILAMNERHRREFEALKNKVSNVTSRPESGFANDNFKETDQKLGSNSNPFVNAILQGDLRIDEFLARFFNNPNVNMKTMGIGYASYLEALSEYGTIGVERGMKDMFLQQFRAEEENKRKPPVARENREPSIKESSRQAQPKEKDPELFDEKKSENKRSEGKK